MPIGYRVLMSYFMQFSLGITVAIALNLVIQKSSGDVDGLAYTVHVTKNDDASDAESRNAVRANDGLFYVRGRGSAGAITFLVDTGASHVVLGHNDLKKLKFSPIKTSHRDYLKTAAEKIQVKWVIIDELAVGGSTLRNVRAAIPNADIGISLLGQNALAQFQSVSITGDEITFDRD